MQVYMNQFRFGAISASPSFHQENNYIATVAPFQSDWATRTVYQNTPNGQRSLVGSVKQAQNATTEVNFLNGKAGLSAVVKTPKLVYIALPGSELHLQDTDVVMYGGKPLGKTTETFTSQPPAKAQTVTNQAILLCAGFATRMEPLSGPTTGFAKPAVPLVGNQSIAEFLIRQMAQHGITHVVAHTFYMNDKMKAVLKNINVPGVTVDILDTGNALGNAAVLSQALRAKKLDANKPTLVVAGDAVTTANFTDLLNAHQAHNAGITLGVKRVDDADVPSFGIVKTDEPSGVKSGEIERFIEKPSLKEAGNNRLANTGMYVLSPSIYEHLMQVGDSVLNAPKKDGKANVFDYALNFFPAWMAKKPTDLKQGAHMWAQVVDGFWHDVGNPNEYMEVIHDIAEGRLGKEMADLLHKENFREGAMYWHGAEEKAKAENAIVRGNAIVTPRPDALPVGRNLNLAA